MNKKERGITLEDLSQQKPDEDVLEAAAHLADYTEEAQQVILNEMHRRGLIEIPQELVAVRTQRG